MQFLSQRPIKQIAIKDSAESNEDLILLILLLLLLLLFLWTSKIEHR